MKKKILVAVMVLVTAVLSLSLVACKVKAGYTSVDAQATIFTELNAKTADVGILDYTMAKYLLSQDTAMANTLQIVEGIEYDAESYGIAFRKGSEKLCDVVNTILNDEKGGFVTTIANSFGLKENVLDLSYTAKASFTADEVADWNYIVNKGTFIVGYTLNPPMAMKNSDGSLTGFDIELPRAVVSKMSAISGKTIEVIFQEITWSEKENELNTKKIDCVWNGLTITPARSAAMTISTPYLRNKQVVIIRKKDAKKFVTKDDLKNARVIAEDGSAGAEIGEAIFK